MCQARHEALRGRSTVRHSSRLGLTSKAWCALESAWETRGSPMASNSTTGSKGLEDDCTVLNLPGWHGVRSSPGDTWGRHPYGASTQWHVRSSGRIHPPPISLKPRLASKPETHSHHLEYGVGNFALVRTGTNGSNSI